MSLENGFSNSQRDRFGISGFTEEYLLEIAVPSGASFREITECILLPERVEGLRILDVGAGASDATAELLRFGADAYAIDPLFRSKSELRGKVKKHNRLVVDKTDLKIERANAIERFAQSIKKNPERYVQASATSIPFEENFFDIVYSRIAILPYLDFDIEILTQAIQECLRVTKPGGSIRLFPYMYEEIGWPEEVNNWRLIIEKRVTAWLEKNKSVSSVTDESLNIRGLDWRLLVIQKAE